MRNCMMKATFREIRSSFGRYVAILAIVALGVGFFGGLKVTKPVMIQAGDQYIREHALYDYWLINTLGFEEEDVEAVRQDENVLDAQGSFYGDFLCKTDSGDVYVIKAHALTGEINRPDMLKGRLPEASDECVLDERARSLTGFTELELGDTIVLDDSNSEDTFDTFTHREYKVVGFVNSPYYLNYERGTSKLGSGKVSAFIYIPMEGFDTGYYSEIFVKLKDEAEIYSPEYDALIDRTEDRMEELCETQAMRRYDSIVAEAQEEVDDARAELEDKKAEAEKKLEDAYDELVTAQEELDDATASLNRQEEALKAQENNLLAIPEQLRPAEAVAAIDSGKAQIRSGRAQLADAQEEIDSGFEEYEKSKAEFDEEITDAEAKLADAQQEIDDIDEPDYYVLTRDSNVGYACYENDSDIVESISSVFPLFFFLVAALVCMTTMNRMVEDQRTQIGVLKALGYSDGQIMGKFIFYAGSAALAGGTLGFTAGCYVFPEVIWSAYNTMYGFARIEYIFDVPLFVISMAAALLCSMGATYFTCRTELASTPADLIRPKAPKGGNRVFLEYISFIWNRMKFLQKVSVRNLFRYKKRFFMMIVGIGGCTALLLTGYGIKDSVAGTVDIQYDEIQLYDALVSFETPLTDSQEEELAEETKDVAESFVSVREEAVKIESDGGEKECTMVVPRKTDSFEEYVNLHTADHEPISYPGEGEAVLSRKMADRLDLQVGDAISFRGEDGNSFTCTISGVCQNFVYNYIYISKETYEKAVGSEPEYGHAMFNIREDQDIHEAAAVLCDADHVSGASVNQDFRERFDNMIVSMDYIVMVIILCAGALAFIVLYNLTNINITERIREIATIKVLGFYPKETASYVFKENFALTAIGAAVGLFLGVYLHKFVMVNVDLEMISFDMRIEAQSYLFSFLLTFLFTAIVDVVMYYKLDKIDMVESLKSIE